jgi:hypothetical protein
MRITIGLLSVSVAILGACASGNTTDGVRSDGLAVECEEEGDYQMCTPEDGDDECETWEDGGPAVVLWPPNHKLVRFTLDICAAPQDDCEEPTDDGSDDGEDGSDDGGDVGVTIDRVLAGPTGATPVEITSITADEDIEVGAGGDGHTTDFDMAIVDEVSFDLRSERQGGGDGRVYRVHYLDENGDEGSCEFLVPHDRGPHGGAVDSGTVVTLEP